MNPAPTHGYIRSRGFERRAQEGRAMQLSMEQRRLLEWLSAKPDGRCLMTWLPEWVRYKDVLALQRGRYLSKRKMQSSFVGIELTEAGRAALRDGGENG